jgi:CO/xanthine dehydrogenase FAD-binding subunit
MPRHSGPRRMGGRYTGTLILMRRHISFIEYETSPRLWGMFATTLELGELITEVHFPLAEHAAPGIRYAMVGAFIAKTQSGIHVAATGAGQNGVFRHKAFEEAFDRSFTVPALDDIKHLPIC